MGVTVAGRLNRALLVFAVMVVLATVSAHVAAAAPEAAPAGTPAACVGLNVYHAVARRRTLCHVHSYPSLNVTPSFDGGHEYHYDIEGVHITLPVPPANFDAATASPDERKFYGIPAEPSPTEASAYASWQRMIHNYHVVPAPPDLYSPGGTAEQTFNTEGTSRNWSGYIDTGKKGSYKMAGVAYTEPSAASACHGSAASFWAGLGGAPTTPLDQDGTQIGPGFAIAEHQAWFEIYPQEAAVPVNLFATPGYGMMATVTDEVGNEVTATLYNLHTGEAVPVKATSTEAFDGSTAEFIAERPAKEEGSLTSLDNFGEWQVKEAWANGNHTWGPWHFTHLAVNMLESETLLAKTSALASQESGQEFSVKWLAYNHENGTTCPDPPPVATTESASNVAEASATLNASVNPNGGATHYYFQYGTTPAYGSSTAEGNAGAGKAAVPVSANISGLSSGVTYHYRIVATGAYGEVSYGSDKTFATPTEINLAFADSTDSGAMSDWRLTELAGWNLNQLFVDSSTAKSSPSALLNNGAPEIYFVDASASNSIGRWIWNRTPPQGWSLSHLGGDTVAAGTSPYAVFFNGVINVLFVNASYGNTISDWQLTEAGWTISRFESDEAAPGTSPSAVVNNGVLHVFFNDASAGDTIADWKWSASELSLSRFYSDKVVAGSSPSALVNNGVLNVLFADATDSETVSDWRWSPSELTLSQFFSDKVVHGSSPSALVNNGVLNVFFADATDSETVSDWRWSPSELTLSQFFSDKLAKGSSPSATVRNGSLYVAFADATDNGTVSYWYWSPKELALVRLFTDAVVAGSSPSAIP